MMVSLEKIWKARAYVPPFENFLLDIGKSSGEKNVLQGRHDFDKTAESQPHCVESAPSPIANQHHVSH